MQYGGILYVKYRIAGKFGEFGELSVIRQTKTIQIFTYNYYLMAESIHSRNAHNSEFAKLSRYTQYAGISVASYVTYNM